MCTSIVYKTKDTYFGRNLDLEYSYQETITVTPRDFPLRFRTMPTINTHYAIIGVAFVAPDSKGQDYPLYYDAINERGLGIAGLNFVGNAHFFPKLKDKDNIAPFEFIPWILSQCATVTEAKKLLSRMSFYNQPFSPELPLAELHWLIADSKSCITVESTADGLHIYDNPAGVLTNNPPFPAQLFQLNNYMSISPADPANTFSPELELYHYGRGIGTRNLPGGLDSQSRFVRACFMKSNSVSAPDELSSISQYFHILHSCDQPRGCDVVPHTPAHVTSTKSSSATAASTGALRTDSANYEITLYSSGYNLNKGICYYTTYDNHQISAVSMKNTNLDSNALINFPMLTTEQINYQN